MRDRACRIGGRVGDRFRYFGGRRGGDRRGLGLRKVCRSVSSAGIAPPSFVLADPTQRGAAGRAGEFRLADPGGRAAMIAVPTAGFGDVRELAAASRTRMERPRRLEFRGGRKLWP